VTQQDDERLQRIWAPWRLDYVQAIHADQGKCIFCVPDDTHEDRARYIIVRRPIRQPTCFAMLNRYPYNNGHLLAAPMRHVATLGDLTDEEMTDLMHLVRELIELLERTLKPQGFNVGLNLGRAAGAGIVEHLHFHIVPRWPGDTNFMPATAGTKVMPQSLESLWELLRASAGPE